MKPSEDGAIRIEGSNLLYVIDDRQNGRCVIKQYKHGRLSTKMIKYFLLSLLGINIPVEYRPPKQRRDFELKCIALWEQKGYQVPQVMPIPNSINCRRPSICIAYIEGERLDEYLANRHRSMGTKLELIASLFVEMRDRHCIAIFEENHRLIHYDANLRNVIIADGQIVYVDFEMGHLSESIHKSAAREVKKLTLQILNQFLIKKLDTVVELLVFKYQIHHILQKMINKELKRSLQSYHLKHDANLKRNNPKLITKIDLARKLKEKIEKNTSRISTLFHNRDLVQSIETSWDGKFYQSLDDCDPRGRNMKHRYEVMKTPQHFYQKTVLDIGCNIGRICFDTKKLGATRTVGIDNREDVINSMDRYYRNSGYDVELYTFDINDGVEALKAVIGPNLFDYVFVLSIWSHVDAKKLWEIINAYCQEVCWFEDNSPSRVKSLDRIQQTLKDNLAFSKIEFMGFTTDRGVRAVFRLTK